MNDGNPTLGLVPIRIVPMFINRLNGWAAITALLIKNLSSVLEQEMKLANCLVKSSEDTSTALKSDLLNSFGESESFRTLLSSITEQQAKQANLISSSANNIEEQLIPILKELLEQIKRRIGDPDNLWTSLDREMKSDIDTFVKLTQDLRSSLMKQQWKGDSMENLDSIKDAPSDPWVVNLALQKHMARCHLKQEKYKSNILKQEEEFSSFEATIIQNIKVTLSTYYEWRVHCTSQQVDQFLSLKEYVDNLNPELDWSLFKIAKTTQFIDLTLLKPPTEIFYEGHDDSALIVLKQGRLFKKEGVFKKQYRLIEAVLTKANFLHVLPERKPNEKFYQMPEFTIDLNLYTLQPLLMNEKEPEEISMVRLNAGFLSKTSGIFGRDVKYKFKGTSIMDSAEWWGHINEQMNRASQHPVRVLNVQVSANNSQKVASPERKTEPIEPNGEHANVEAAHTIGLAKTNQDEFEIRDSPLKDVNPETSPLEKLSVTEKMELMERELRSKSVLASPEILDSPEFGETFANTSTNETGKYSVWDTFQGDNEGW